MRRIVFGYDLANHAFYGNPGLRCVAFAEDEDHAEGAESAGAVRGLEFVVAEFGEDVHDCLEGGVAVDVPLEASDVDVDGCAIESFDHVD